MRHNPLILSAEDVANAINEKLDIVATIETDGKDDHMWNFVELDEETSKDTASRMEAAKIRPTVVVSGLCWLVSMLSLIGGNWYVNDYSFQTLPTQSDSLMQYNVGNFSSTLDWSLLYLDYHQLP